MSDGPIYLSGRNGYSVNKTLYAKLAKSSNSIPDSFAFTYYGKSFDKDNKIVPYKTFKKNFFPPSVLSAPKRKIIHFVMIGITTIKIITRVVFLSLFSIYYCLFNPSFKPHDSHNRTQTLLYFTYKHQVNFLRLDHLELKGHTTSLTDETKGAFYCQKAQFFKEALNAESATGVEKTLYFENA